MTGCFHGVRSPGPADAVPVPLHADGPGQPRRPDDPEFEALFDQISKSVDADEREDLIHQAVDEITDEVLEAPLYSVGAFLGPVVSECVAEYAGALFGTRLEEASIKADCRN